MDNEEKIIGPGTIILGEVQAGLEAKISDVLDAGKRQLVGGCLEGTPAEDDTKFMLKKETIFYVNTDALKEAGSIKMADTINAKKNLMLDARSSANKAFDEALKMVDQATGSKAIQVLNYVKEVVYYNNFNNYHQHADHTSQGINSQSELELSWVKAKLASQLADGSFKREIDAREKSGMAMVCEDHSLVK
ncbi:hypothetical protein [Methylotenera sp. G11]|uniref:hypothetical protein n=1 Tax=Methylotenera sp. G11 TaxID=1506585 RepID=UPI0006466E59|nr:hypothetical protein [Methylotenera sp. G11]